MKYFFRCWKAHAIKIIRTEFFRPATIVWNLVLPIGWGLNFYFLYFPFKLQTMIENLFGTQFDIPLLEYTLSGQLVWILFIDVALFGGVFFMYEKFEGTIETLFLTPAPRIALMLGSTSAALINFTWFFLGLISIILILNIPLHISSFLAVLISLVTALLSISMMGILFQGMFIGFRIGPQLTTSMQEPLQFTTGLIFPIRFLPRILIFMSLGLPLTYSFLLIRGTIFAGLTMIDISYSILFLIILGICYGIIGILLVKKIESHLKKAATLTFF